MNISDEKLTSLDFYNNFKIYIYSCMMNGIFQASSVVASDWEKEYFSFQVLRSPLSTHTQMW